MEAFKKFLKQDERGSLSVEAVIVFPLLIWAFVATFVFWDLFYAKSINMRAAYTIGDTLSRETDYVDAAYLDGMSDMLAFLLKGQHMTRLRVTTVLYDDVNERFEVEWSFVNDDSWDRLYDDTLQDYADQIPPLAKGDIAIIVESDLGFVPFFEVGIDQMVMSDFVVTRPRFGPQLAWRKEDGTFIEADGVDNEDAEIDYPDHDPVDEEV